MPQTRDICSCTAVVISYGSRPNEVLSCCPGEAQKLAERPWRLPASSGMASFESCPLSHCCNKFSSCCHRVALHQTRLLMQVVPSSVGQVPPCTLSPSSCQLSIPLNTNLIRFATPARLSTKAFLSAFIFFFYDVHCVRLGDTG